MQRSRATTALDWLTLALVILPVAIAWTGGISVRIGGSRLTARSPDRAALAALAVLVCRVAIDRRTRPLANAPRLYRQLRDWVYDPVRDAVSADVAPSASRSRRRFRLAAAIGFSAFAVVLLLPQLRHMDSVPDLGDPLF